MPVKRTIIPNLRYRDAVPAIEFLCQAFGFEERAVFADPEDASMVHHAQLVLDGNMIMVSSVVDSEFAKVLTTVEEAGGNTQTLYVTLDDVDGHAEQARSKGARIFMEPEDQDYGGRSYSVLDTEGNAWTFGSYDPFAES